MVGRPGRRDIEGVILKRSDATSGALAVVVVRGDPS